jgi:cytochrome c-type biogenesis protein CcmF
VTASIGHSSIIIAFIAALIGIMSPIVAARSAGARFRAVAGYAILGQFVFVTLAAVALIYGLIATDFSIKYVAFNTTRATPVYYRVTGLWGALEGSLLLWEWILIIFAGIVAWVYRPRHHDLMPWVIMIVSIVSAFFVGVIGFLS